MMDLSPQRRLLPLCILGLAFGLCSPSLIRVAVAQVRFQPRVIDAESQHNSVAAFDVNQDGQCDIVTGGWWYEAPHWQKRKVRDVEMIRGRFDDYSCNPLDVNGDGWTDFISMNYRSKSLYWVEHPGKTSGVWSRHLIDTPGPAETGRLVDINQDGRLDLLPNGTRYAAWWELQRQPADDAGTSDPQWLRHDLPTELVGHGLGHGDINGDGRLDLISPRGWAEAPQDRPGDRWIWHAEFQLHRDGSVPILAYDVDHDGDCDLVWGRGHDVGVYWLEQTTADDAKRVWVRRAIDTTISNAHSLLLADLDNNGQQDLIVGKRYLGHDGKDPGEYNPHLANAYTFDAKLRTWQRHPILRAGRVGFGTDPKAVDLDGDGDCDLLCSDRNGLVLLENLLIHKQPLPALTVTPPADSNHTDLTSYRAPNGKSLPLTTPFHWGTRRDQILRGMEQAMGPFPEPAQRVPLEIQIEQQDKTDKYLRQKITFAAEPGDRIPAYLLLPHNLSEPAPAMLCLHQTTAIGKAEPAGLGGKPTLHYAHELANRGYVCIVPDYPSFGDYTYDFGAAKHHYASGSMKAIWNNVRAVDVLETLAFVDHDRIGVIGHSLGGHNALFTAAFEQRLRAVVTSCGFTAFHHYYEGKLQGWTSARYMPRIRETYGNSPDRVPFDFYEVLGALAPRPLFVNAPLHDGNFAVVGVQKIEREVSRVYELFRQPEQLRFVYPDAGHTFPDEVRDEVYDWLDQRLKR